MAQSLQLSAHISSRTVSRQNLTLQIPVKAQLPKTLPKGGRLLPLQKRCFTSVKCSASGVTSGNGGTEEDPYAVLGVNPLRGFEAAMTAHKRKRKDAEANGDKDEVERLDAAYNKIMMKQFDLRKKGLGTGSFQISKDIKYADQIPIVPWFPRKTKATTKDKFINFVLSAAFVLVNIAKGYSEYRYLQFMIFAYVLRIFFKIKGLVGDAPRDEYDEEGNSVRDQSNGKIMLRSVGLVFGVVTVASVMYYLAVKGFVLGFKTYPRFLAAGQEIVTTLLSAIFLFIIGTFYR